MEDSQYQYLDGERIKLWSELRQTQDQVKTILTALEVGLSDEQKAFMRLSRNAAGAYHRIQARDAETEQFSDRIKAAQDLGRECIDLLANLKGLRTQINSSANEVKAARDDFDEEIAELEDRANALKEREQKIEEFVNKSESTSDEAQVLLEEIEEKHADSDKKYQEIAKFHRMLWGYSKENGEVVEGKKQELETTYEELERKINATTAGADAFEKEYKEKCSTFLEGAKAEAEALSNKVRGLLPDAMTAGLSSAYLDNRKAEEEEQRKQMGLFKICIWSMMLIALLPVGLNLWLWLGLHKDLLDILALLPREATCILPIYIPLFWLAIFANKRVNLSKRLIEEYKHKEAVSKTYEGLSRQISEIDDEEASAELQRRLLYNTIMLSEKNPGELIKNFNRPDNPLLDMLNQGSRLAEAVDQFVKIPGVEHFLAMTQSIAKKKNIACNDAKDPDGPDEGA